MLFPKLEMRKSLLFLFLICCFITIVTAGVLENFSAMLFS